MNRILLTGIAAVSLVAATFPAAAASHKVARHHEDVAVALQAFGSGARVEEVLPNTPAARAGIRAGDVIVAIGGRPVSGYADLDNVVGASGGRPLTIDIDRGGTRLRLRATPMHALVQRFDLFGNVDHRFVLGVAHTEFRFISCALDPDCE
jgi:S1-C subfamily serine protease